MDLAASEGARPAEGREAIYEPSCTGRLRQGEVIGGIEVFTPTLGGGRVEGKERPREFLRIHHPLAIVITQDCDLEQDYKSRFGGNKPDLRKVVPWILMGELFEASAMRVTKANPDGFNNTQWSPVKINQSPRYHFLEAVPSDGDALKRGLPAMVADFKRYFTVSTEYFYHCLERGTVSRSTVLRTPWAEHFSSRFAHYLARVGLPRDHESKPPAPSLPKALPGASSEPIGV